MKKFITSTLAILSVSAIHAQAATFTVTNTNNSGAGSLRQAIISANAAAGADDIVFDASFNTPQTITLATSLAINGANDTLTITGPGANLLTISGNNAVAIFVISAGETTSISGMTITQAVGGAVDNSGTLTVTNCTLTANADTNGGAISSDGPMLTVTGCTFTDNTNSSGSVGGSGGAAIFNESPATVTDCTFTNNMTTGGAGGGAIDNRGALTITGCNFTGNAVIGDGQNASGGAIATFGAGQLTISNSVITGNSAVRDGGGVYYRPNNAGTFLTVTNSTISNNTANSDSNATGDGGGLFLGGTGSVTISASTIYGNTANAGAAGSTSGDGGGIDVTGPSTITNSTVSGNTAGRDGGGIYASGVSTIILNLTNSTIVNNTATRDGGGVVRGSSSNPVNFRNTIVANNTDDGTAPDVFGIVISNGFNLIKNTTGAGFPVGPTDIIGVDPNLGLLQNNGGATLTHAFLAGSGAIDKGHSSGATTDQRGMPRPFDQAIPNAAGGDGADIGAFEAEATVATFVVTNDADSGPGSLRDALMQANSNAQPDTIAFDPVFFATARTIVLASEIEITADGTNPGQQVIIDGPGADLVTVSGNNAVRPFYVAPNADVVMSGMTIRDGNGVGQ